MEFSLLYIGVLTIIFISNNLLIIGEARYYGAQKNFSNHCGEVTGQSNSSATDEFPIQIKKSLLMRGLAQFYNPWKKIFQNQNFFKSFKNDAIDSELYEDGLDRKINQGLKSKEERPVLEIKPKIKKIKNTDDDKAKVLNNFEEEIDPKVYVKDEENLNADLNCKKDMVISTAYPPKRKMTLSFYTVITEPYDEEPDDIKADRPTKIKIVTQKSTTSNQVLIIKAPSYLGTLPVIVVKDNDNCSLTLTIKNKTDDEDKLLKNNNENNQRGKETDDAAPLTFIEPEFNLINPYNKYTPKKNTKKPQTNNLFTDEQTKLNPEGEMDLKSFLLQIKNNRKSNLSPSRSQNNKKITKEKKLPMYMLRKDLHNDPQDYTDIRTERNNITDLQSKINENLIEQLILLKKIKMS